MSKDKYPSIFSKLNRSYCVYYPSNIFRNTHGFENLGLFNNYSPKWRWLAVDRYLPSREAYYYTKIIYSKKINFDDFFTCHGSKPGRHFLSSCSEVNSTRYSEFDEPISARHQRYALF